MPRRAVFPAYLLAVGACVLARPALAAAAPRQAADRPAAPGVTQPAATRIGGVVVDASGAPVPGAVVTADAVGGSTIQTTTGADGRFWLTGLPGAVVDVRAVAPGFDPAYLRVGPEGSAEVRLVLYPARLHDVVTVTASRGAARLETPAATTVVTSAELLTSAAPMVDDVLRNTPGFSLFRRSSSRVSVPSAQGATLRGLSGSGASRTMVLADGLPLNDAFGSWVYWNRVPVAAIDRVEVVRGAAGDLYGADALGGVVHILTFSPSRPRLRALLEGGSADTVRASLFAAGQSRGWTGAAAGEWSDTDGVVRVAPEQRGPIDTPVTSDYRTAFVTAGYDAGRWRGHLRAHAYDEDRSRGTPLLVDDTTWRQVAGELAGTLADGAWLVRAAGGSQSYFNNFSAISADRTSERLTREQRIPAAFAQVSAQWARDWGRSAIVLGGEGRRTRATVYETRYSLQGIPSGPFVAGGTEVDGAFFARMRLRAADRLTIVAGARTDLWRSRPRDPALPRHTVNFLSPSASVAWQASAGFGVRAAAYRAYRTPTLNELHRGFRVGDVVTDPNPQLDPERLTGLEAGVLVARRRVSARVTGFWSHLDEAIANVTLSVTPSLITRQKQNADQVRAAGVEAELDVRPHRRLTLAGVAAFTASHFSHTPKQPAIQGKRVPQVPVYQLGATATYADPRGLTASLQLRAVGAQFDDDLNQFELRAFVVADGALHWSVHRRVHLFVAGENLFDAEYDVGRTPTRTIGWPRTGRAGLRVFLP
jgi:outer membrane cobalamin receptor